MEDNVVFSANSCQCFFEPKAFMFPDIFSDIEPFFLDNFGRKPKIDIGSSSVIISLEPGKFLNLAEQERIKGFVRRQNSLVRSRNDLFFRRRIFAGGNKAPLTYYLNEILRVKERLNKERSKLKRKEKDRSKDWLENSLLEVEIRLSKLKRKLEKEEEQCTDPANHLWLAISKVKKAEKAVEEMIDRLPIGSTKKDIHWLVSKLGEVSESLAWTIKFNILGTKRSGLIKKMIKGFDPIKKYFSLKRGVIMLEDNMFSSQERLFALFLCQEISMDGLDEYQVQKDISKVIRFCGHDPLRKTLIGLRKKKS